MDHCRLAVVKERILQNLDALHPILLVGPPGVGKTSLGRAIAHATGRKCIRINLGGLQDEAELRPLLEAIAQRDAVNLVLMLDEVDKMGRDLRGDPVAILLQIVAQKPFEGFFIAAANTTEPVPQPLLDRMELLRLSGYSEEEKMQIARRYLLPRQWRHAGLALDQLELPDESLQQIIRRYTREEGLRQLERQLGSVARKAAVQFAEGRTQPLRVASADLADLLGPARFP